MIDTSSEVFMINVDTGMFVVDKNDLTIRSSDLLNNDQILFIKKTLDNPSNEQFTIFSLFNDDESFVDCEYSYNTCNGKNSSMACTCILAGTFFCESYSMRIEEFKTRLIKDFPEEVL